MIKLFATYVSTHIFSRYLAYVQVIALHLDRRMLFATVVAQIEFFRVLSPAKDSILSLLFKFIKLKPDQIFRRFKTRFLTSR